MTTFDRNDWPHGLRCLSCDNKFADDQPIAKRLISVNDTEDFRVEIVCVFCSLGGHK